MIFELFRRYSHLPHQVANNGINCCDTKLSKYPKKIVTQVCYPKYIFVDILGQCSPQQTWAATTLSLQRLSLSIILNARSRTVYHGGLRTVRFSGPDRLLAVIVAQQSINVFGFPSSSMTVSSRLSADTLLSRYCYRIAYDRVWNKCFLQRYVSPHA